MHANSTPKGDREDTVVYRARVVAGDLAVVIQVLPTHEIQVQAGIHVWRGTASDVEKLLPKSYVWGILPQILREVCEALAMAIKVIGQL